MLNDQVKWELCHRKVKMSLEKGDERNIFYVGNSDFLYINFSFHCLLFTYIMFFILSIKHQHTNLKYADR